MGAAEYLIFSRFRVSSHSSFCHFIKFSLSVGLDPAHFSHVRVIQTIIHKKLRHLLWLTFLLSRSTSYWKKISSTLKIKQKLII